MKNIVRKQLKPLSPSGESFHLPNIQRSIGQTDAEHLKQLRDAIKHLESAIQSIGVRQCPNCTQPIPPGSKMLLGGICYDCWKEDPDIDCRVDFSTLTDHEIARQWKIADVGMEMRKKNPDNGMIVYACAMQSYIGKDRILQAIRTTFWGRDAKDIVDTSRIVWEGMRPTWKAGMEEA